MMCYYLNVQFQGQRVKIMPVDSSAVLPFMIPLFCYVASCKTVNWCRRSGNCCSFIFRVTKKSKAQRSFESSIFDISQKWLQGIKGVNRDSWPNIVIPVTHATSVWPHWTVICWRSFSCACSTCCRLSFLQTGWARNNLRRTGTLPGVRIEKKNRGRGGLLWSNYVCECARIYLYVFLSTTGIFFYIPFYCTTSLITYLLTPRSRVLLEKLTSKLCS